MRKKVGAQDLVLLEGGFLLKDVFEDSYEYEEYFRLINSIDLYDYFPSEFEVEFDDAAKAPRLKYPKDKPDYVLLVLPVSKKFGSPRKRSALRKIAFQKYGGLIPKIRLEMKDELAMRKKLLAPNAEKGMIAEIVKDARRRGLRRLKNRLARTRRIRQKGTSGEADNELA